MPKLKYLHVTLLPDNIVRVGTPKPYTINMFEIKDEEYIDNKMYELNEACLFLYNTMKLLDIPKKVAIVEGYTLNKTTGEKLLARACIKEGLSHEYFMLIKKHDW